MTGESSFSEHCLQYYRWLISGALLAVGNFLLWEHFIRFGGFDLELLGHEYYGLALILLGFLIAIKWNQLSGLMKAIRERNWEAMLDEGERK